MKKSKTIIIGSIILIICLFALIIYNNFSRKIDIKSANKGWNIYDKSISNIKDNISAIAKPNQNFEWGTLKDIDIDDIKYKNTLNSLLADVRMCYLEYTDDGTLYTNSNSIRKYRDKKNISKRELKELTDAMIYEQRNGCLKYFEKYNVLLISNDKILRNKIYNITNSIADFKLYVLHLEKNETYDELLTKKILEVHLLEDISKFLIDEYDRLK